MNARLRGKARSRVTSVGLIVLPDPAEGFDYPAHIDRASLDALPRKPGIYIFRDAAGIALYIGKSIDIRNRVLSHLRTPQEAALLQQSVRVDFQRTAGEIGALLLESTLVKTFQPIHNAQLKLVRETWSLSLTCTGMLTVVGESEDLPGRHPRFGLYPSRSSAQSGLLELARQHRLCPALLGLETAILGRACFGYQIGRCLGACAGHESLDAHEERTLAALAGLEQAVWPHGGPVGIVEQDGALRQVHVIDRWSYLGTLEGRRRTLRRPAGTRADADTFRILALQLSGCEVEHNRIILKPGAVREKTN
jgi:excinuclease Cho